jgi:2'-5' RNA ligase
MRRTNDMTTGGEGTALRRLFVALLPDAPVRDELVRRQRLLLPSLARAKPTARGNLHLTLAFLGMLGEEKSTAALDAMCGAAQLFAAGERMARGGDAVAPYAGGADGSHAGGAAAPYAGLTLALGDIGHFDKRGGSVLWQGIAEDAECERLVRLQAILADCLRERGLPLEDRPYVPHMTLARGARLKRVGRDENNRCVRDDAGEEPMDEFLAQVNARISSSHKETPAMRAGAISLMWSHHPADGELTYTEIARVPLA